MNVTFAFISPEIASSRLRADIPQKELEKLGIKRGKDILVYSKHVVPMHIALHYGKRVFDICDDHFHSVFEQYYREHSMVADLITVNTDEMAKIVLKETGRTAIVIPDPYESDEQPAGYGKGSLWFGHESNLRTIEPYMGLVDRVLTHPEWTREKQLEAIKDCAVVVIPTDERKGKSANRLIEAVRNGRFVVAGELPAHDEFKDFMWIGDIKQGLEWTKNNPEKCLENVFHCQHYIRDRFSPETIGKLWFSTLKNL